MKRFTTTSQYDPSITQQVRTALMEGGHYDLVAEQMVDGLRDIETLQRKQYKDHEQRLKMLEYPEAPHLRETSVIRLIDAKLTGASSDWAKWALRGLLAALGAALLAGIWQLCALAYKGATTH